MSEKQTNIRNLKISFENSLRHKSYQQNKEKYKLARDLIKMNLDFKKRHSNNTSDFFRDFRKNYIHESKYTKENVESIQILDDFNDNKDGFEEEIGDPSNAPTNKVLAEVLVKEIEQSLTNTQDDDLVESEEKNTVSEDSNCHKRYEENKATHSFSDKSKSKESKSNFKHKTERRMNSTDDFENRIRFNNYNEKYDVTVSNELLLQKVVDVDLRSLQNGHTKRRLKDMRGNSTVNTDNLFEEPMPLPGSTNYRKDLTPSQKQFIEKLLEINKKTIKTQNQVQKQAPITDSAKINHFVKYERDPNSKHVIQLQNDTTRKISENVNVINRESMEDDSNQLISEKPLIGVDICVSHLIDDSNKHSTISKRKTIDSIENKGYQLKNHESNSNLIDFRYKNIDEFMVTKKNFFSEIHTKKNSSFRHQIRKMHETPNFNDDFGTYEYKSRRQLNNVSRDHILTSFDTHDFEKLNFNDDGYSSGTNRTMSDTMEDSTFQNIKVTKNFTTETIILDNNDNMRSNDIYLSSRDALNKNYSKSMTDLKSLDDDLKLDETISSDDNKSRRKSIESKLESLLKAKVKSMNDINTIGRTTTLPYQKIKEQKIKKNYVDAPPVIPPRTYKSNFVYTEPLKDPDTGNRKVNQGDDYDQAKKQANLFLKNGQESKDIALKESMLTELRNTVKGRNATKKTTVTDLFPTGISQNVAENQNPNHSYNRRQQVPRDDKYSDESIQDALQSFESFLLHNEIRNPGQNQAKIKKEQSKEEAQLPSAQFVRNRRLSKPDIAYNSTKNVSENLSQTKSDIKHHDKTDEKPINKDAVKTMLKSHLKDKNGLPDSLREYANNQPMRPTINNVFNITSQKTSYSQHPSDSKSTILVQNQDLQYNNPSKEHEQQQVKQQLKIQQNKASNNVQHQMLTRSYSYHSPTAHEKRKQTVNETNQNHRKKYHFDETDPINFTLRKPPNKVNKTEKSIRLKDFNFSLSQEEFEKLRMKRQAEKLNNEKGKKDEDPVDDVITNEKIFQKSVHREKRLQRLLEADQKQIVKVNKVGDHETTPLNPLKTSKNENIYKAKSGIKNATYKEEQNVPSSIYNGKNITKDPNYNFSDQRKKETKRADVIPQIPSAIDTVIEEKSYVESQPIYEEIPVEKSSKEIYSATNIGKIDIPKNFQTVFRDSDSRRSSFAQNEHFSNVSSTPGSPKKRGAKSPSPRTSRPSTPQYFSNKLKTLFSPNTKTKVTHENGNTDLLISTDNEDITRRMNINKSQHINTWAFDSNKGIFNGSIIDDGDNVDVDFITNQDWLDSQKNNKRDTPTENNTPKPETQQKSKPKIKQAMIPLQSNDNHLFTEPGKVIVPEVFGKTHRTIRVKQKPSKTVFDSKIATLKYKPQHSPKHIIRSTHPSAQMTPNDIPDVSMTSVDVKNGTLHYNRKYQNGVVIKNGTVRAIKYRDARMNALN